MSRKNYFSNRISINQIKDDLGIIGDPSRAALEKPGIQRLNNSAIRIVNKREFSAFRDSFITTETAFDTFNQKKTTSSTKTLHYRDPVSNAHAPEPYSCFDGPDKPTKGQIVVIENPYYKGQLDGDIRITDGGKSFSGVTFPPTGTLGYFAYDDKTPDGWLECNGQPVLYRKRLGQGYVDTEYTRLYEILYSWGIFTDYTDITPDATYGKVFRAPNLTGFFVRGLNVTSTGLEDNSSLQRKPFDRTINIDVVDHEHTGYNPYNRPEKITKVWFRRPNYTPHRSGELGQWEDTSSPPPDPGRGYRNQNGYRHHRRDVHTARYDSNSGNKIAYQGDGAQGRYWYPTPSTGYEVYFFGRGGGKFSLYGETNPYSYGWGYDKLYWDDYMLVNYKYYRGAPKGLWMWHHDIWHRHSNSNSPWTHGYMKVFYANEKSAHPYEGEGDATKGRIDYQTYVEDWSHGNDNGTYHHGNAEMMWDDLYDYSNFVINLEVDNQNAAQTTGWYKKSFSNVGQYCDHAPDYLIENKQTVYQQNVVLRQNTGRRYGIWCGKYANQSYYYNWQRGSDWHDEGVTVGDGADSTGRSNSHIYYPNASVVRRKHENEPPTGPYGTATSYNDSQDESKNNFRRNPWIWGFDRHYHNNIMTYYRSTWFPDPDPALGYSGWQFPQHSDHTRCNIDKLTLRNEIGWRALNKDRYVYDSSRDEIDYFYWSNEGGVVWKERGSNSRNDDLKSIYMQAGHSGITRRRYMAKNDTYTPHNDHWWVSFCYITKPSVDSSGNVEEALLNTGDNGAKTSLAGDHNHLAFGHEDSVFYQGQEETRPHNVALRMFIKY